tara:strand:+ start:405 stop:785 length:381 start_codon:yes stop_codon:yes gene_type:complete
MEIKKGLLELKKLNKEQTIVFMNSFSYKSLAITFNVSESSARRIIYKKIIDFGIVVPIKKIDFVEVRYDLELSEDDCASVSPNKKQIITKDGLFQFKENLTIPKNKPNRLSQVCKEYIEVMKQNNQ